MSHYYVSKMFVRYLFNFLVRCLSPHLLRLINGWEAALSLYYFIQLIARNQRYRLSMVHALQQNHLSVLCGTRINGLVLLESGQLSRYRTIYSIRWGRSGKLEAEIKLVCSHSFCVSVFFSFVFDFDIQIADHFHPKWTILTSNFSYAVFYVCSIEILEITATSFICLWKFLWKISMCNAHSRTHTPFP